MALDGADRAAAHEELEVVVVWLALALPTMIATARPIAASASIVRPALTCFVATLSTSAVAKATRSRVGADAGALMPMMLSPTI